MRKPNYRFERAERDRVKKAKKRGEAATAAAGTSRRTRRRRRSRANCGVRVARNLNYSFQVWPGFPSLTGGGPSRASRWCFSASSNIRAFMAGVVAPLANDRKRAASRRWCSR